MAIPSWISFLSGIEVPDTAPRFHNSVEILKFANYSTITRTSAASASIVEMAHEAVVLLRNLWLGEDSQMQILFAEFSSGQEMAIVARWSPPCTCRTRWRPPSYFITELH